MTVNKNSSNNNKRKLVALYIALILSIGLVVFFAAALVLDIHTTNRAQNFYSTITVEFAPSPVTAQLQVQEGPVTAYGTTYQFYDYVYEYIPSILSPDFNLLQGQFPNVIGWVQSENTPINYPIVQGTDNTFYLYNLPDGTRNRMGSIFMDYRNSANFSDTITKIYGHNTHTDDMFSTLEQYKSQYFFEQHPSMFIFTPHQNYKLQLFAGYVLDSAFEVPPMHFLSYSYFYEFIADIKMRSLFTSDIVITYGDRIVLLCTCTTGGPRSERLIIAGKLIEI